MARWVGELGQEDCLFLPSKTRAERPYIAALCYFLLTFCACLLEGPWEQNPCLETKKLYFQENTLHKNYWPFLFDEHSTEVSFPLRFSTKVQGMLCYGLALVGRLMPGYSDFTIPTLPFLLFQKPIFRPTFPQPLDLLKIVEQKRMFGQDITISLLEGTDSTENGKWGEGNTFI